MFCNYNASYDKTHSAGISEIEKKHNVVYLGYRTTNNSDGPAHYFMSIKDSSLITTNELYKKHPSRSKSSLIELICEARDIKPTKQLTEWVDIKILDKKFPVIFLLAYRFGLRNILKYLKVDYVIKTRRGNTILDSYRGNIEFYNKKLTDISIKFNDAELIFPRYPLLQSLLVSGLDYFDLNPYMIDEFDHKDVYFSLLGHKHNYLKGIDNFFDLFLADPIAFESLKIMGEPTNPRDLLIRATQMLSDSKYHEASSMYNHRLRGYERFPAIAFNEISREFANFRKRKGDAATFSINPNSVLLRIIQDPAMMNVEDINPLHDLKLQAGITYTGIGGRTSESFTINDRRYPKDGIGMLSEGTVDSGNVAISALAPIDPVIDNVYGFKKDKVDHKSLEPTQFLSPVTLIMPGVTQDDQIGVLLSSNR